MFSGRLKGVATGNFLNGVQFCESPLDLSYLPTALRMDVKVQGSNEFGLPLIRP